MSFTLLLSLFEFVIGMTGELVVLLTVVVDEWMVLLVEFPFPIVLLLTLFTMVVPVTPPPVPAVGPTCRRFLNVNNSVLRLLSLCCR